MARHAKHFQLGLKPGWLYVSRISYSRAMVILSVSKGIFSYIYFYILAISDRSGQFMRRALHLCAGGSWQSLCSSAQPIWGSMYIVIHRYIWLKFTAEYIYIYIYIYIYKFTYSYRPPHMVKKKQDDQLEHTYSNYVSIRDVALKTCQRRWMIGRSGERGSGISVLAVWHDHDDDISL